MSSRLIAHVGEDGAQLQWTVPASGEYVIRVTSAAPGVTGTFVLRVQAVP